MVELIGVTVDDKNFVLVAQWMENGNIVEFLEDNEQGNRLKLARTMFHFMRLSIESGKQLEDAARGLQYLHSMDLAHGDLKAV